MPVSLVWRGPQYRAFVAAESRRRLEASGALIVNRVRVLLSVPARQGVRRWTPSRPGQSPRLRTGRLRASYAWEQAGLSVRIGSDLPYARHLEFGTRRMAPRPHLGPAHRDSLPALRALWARPMRFR